jgi:hypothetical protein
MWETPEKQIRHSTAAIASFWVRRVFTHQEDEAKIVVTSQN